jgi:arsenite-transporting ATPase
VINPQPLPSSDLRLLIFAGKGGVGKTTMACANALQLQRQYPDLRLLLFSTAPHSLSDCLKLKLQALPTQVIGYLDGQEVNPEAEFDSVRCNFRQELAEALIAR